MQVLSARGSELERAFSYGVVRQLFEQFLARLSGEGRAELLTGAAALATSLFEPAQLAEESADDASLATLHGLYWLTANLASRGLLLLAVDDLHCSDIPSLRWLAYLLPRMEGLNLAIVVGLRPGEPGEHPGLLGQIISDPLATVVRPAPLSKEATTRLVRAALSLEADDAFCAASHEETGGNPQLLRELVQAIASEGVAPTRANVPRLRELEARAGSRTIAVRLSRLPPQATRLAQAVAILGDDADPRHAAALADLEAPAAAEAARALARVDVLRPQPPFGFAHPLIRAVVYDALTLPERAAGHARAARLLEAAGAEPERIAAHLLLAPPAADPQVVATLREAARRAGSRGASESAVAYLRRALAEPPSAMERAELLVELGSAEALVSGEAAVEHLQEAHALIEEPIRRAQTALMLGRQLFLLLRGEESHAVFVQALNELAGADAELERLIEAGLITNALHVPSLYREALHRLEHVRRQPAESTVGEKMLLSLLAYHDARAGAPAAVAVPLARRALAEGTLVRAEISAYPFAVPAQVLAMADLDGALAIYEEALAEAHRRGSIFAVTKAFRAQTLVWRGDLGEAETEAREAFAASEAWGTTARFSVLLAAFLANALMEQGKFDDASAALDAARSGISLPNRARPLLFLDSQARLRLLRGDLAGGLADMLDVGRNLEAVGGRNPAFIAWRSHAALALLQLGEQDQAQALASEELELARTWGRPRALGAALRVAGLVEGGRQGLTLIEEAVEVLANSPAKLEHAKAHTDLGAALRRANRRLDAREQLRHALELATICGAVPLIRRAETELLATGARPRHISLRGVESLTPSERRVAEMAAEGPTNREIAQALFVTPKTVEVHLSSAYRKLGSAPAGNFPSRSPNRPAPPSSITGPLLGGGGRHGDQPIEHRRHIDVRLGSGGDAHNDRAIRTSDVENQERAAVPLRRGQPSQLVVHAGIVAEAHHDCVRLTRSADVIWGELLPLPHPFPAANQVEPAGNRQQRWAVIVDQLDLASYLAVALLRLAQTSVNLPSRLKVKRRLGDPSIGSRPGLESWRSSCFRAGLFSGLDLYRERTSDVEDRFFVAVMARNVVQPNVRAIILHDGNFLVQRPADSAPSGGYAFIGSELDIWRHIRESAAARDQGGDTARSAVTGPLMRAEFATAVRRG